MSRNDAATPSTNIKKTVSTTSSTETLRHQNQCINVRSEDPYTTVFDYVILGGGSAGAVLASRLSEDGNKSVLLVEAGPAFAPDAFPEVLYSGNIIAANADPCYEWGYKAVAVKQPEPVYTPRGKVIGGSSAINAAVACRALPYDFDQIGKKGIQGWSFTDVLPYYKKMETSHHGEDKWHGRNGPFPIHQMTMDYLTPWAQASIKSMWELGYKKVEDFNNPMANNGAGPVPMNIVNGVRVNTGIAYLNHEVRKRPNLVILSDTLIDKINFDGKKVASVSLVGGKKVQGKETILSAGAYGSATILMRSGIGPKADLEALGIPVLKDAPVGTHLQDHVFFWINYAGAPSMKDMKHPVVSGQLWTNSTYASSPQELDIAISPSTILPDEMSKTGITVTLGLELMKISSTGSVKLTSRNPIDAPEIHLNHLTHEDDMRRMVECFKIARKMIKTSALKELIVEEIYPGPQVKDDDDQAIRDALAKGATTLQHPSCTVRMGLESDPLAVVDPEGRVYGFQGLRVIDASIFPEIPLINLNPTVIMMAEKLSDTIRGIKTV